MNLVQEPTHERYNKQVIIIIIKCSAEWQSHFYTSCDLEQHISKCVLVPIHAMTKGCQESYVICISLSTNFSSCHILQLSYMYNVDPKMAGAVSVLASSKTIRLLTLAGQGRFNIIL